MLDLNPDFEYALALMNETSHHIFITGRAGSGKSTLLQLFRDRTKKKIAVLAPTGVAALNVRGQTIHSFFGFPSRALNKADIKPRPQARKMFKQLDTIVIDEVSMVRADMLDNIDRFLRLNARLPHLPFGGVQLIFFGDLFQLPPVISTEEERQRLASLYHSPFFFAADVMRTIHFETIVLEKVYRQTSKQFVKLLDHIRLNRADADDLAWLNSRYLPNHRADRAITLATRNSIVDSINQRRLADLPFSLFTYQATITGDFAPASFPAEQLLYLKLGVQVMFVRNDPQSNFVNGTIGTVSHLSDEQVEVTIGTAHPRRVAVTPVVWEMLKYRLNDRDEIETQVQGTFSQYPLRLAWAITIHKSQGKTFDEVVIDLGKGAFEHGQTYVALSRCRTFDGITLAQPIRPQDLLTDERVVEFMEQCR